MSGTVITSSLPVRPRKSCLIWHVRAKWELDSGSDAKAQSLISLLSPTNKGPNGLTLRHYPQLAHCSSPETSNQTNPWNIALSGPLWAPDHTHHFLPELPGFRELVVDPKHQEGALPASLSLS